MMASLAQTHVGWENEHLATYLLSRIAFVARPVTVGDDAGTDLFCTLFDDIGVGRKRVLVPTNSIAIQVKSSRRSIDVSKQLGYLARLEMPYYVGVVDQQAETLAVFSGRYLPNMLSYRGLGTRVRLKLVDRLTGHYRSGSDEKGYVVQFPLVTTLSAAGSRDTLREKRDLLYLDATFALSGIASRLNHEFIFDIPDGFEVFMGPDSARAFRTNFLKRLAEAFHNFAWLLDQGQAVEGAELDVYLEVYATLSRARLIPPQVKVAYGVLVEAKSRHG
jgi:hypothetical protein